MEQWDSFKTFDHLIKQILFYFQLTGEQNDPESPYQIGIGVSFVSWNIYTSRRRTEPDRLGKIYVYYIVIESLKFLYDIKRVQF
jgi:hypothetical protein